MARRRGPEAEALERQMNQDHADLLAKVQGQLKARSYNLAHDKNR